MSWGIPVCSALSLIPERSLPSWIKFKKKPQPFIVNWRVVVVFFFLWHRPPTLKRPYLRASMKAELYEEHLNASHGGFST